jgi:hypothetical protein
MLWVRISLMGAVRFELRRVESFQMEVFEEKAFVFSD